MKFKKLFASALAIALAATIIPATPAKADITATGGATFVNTEKYEVTLPTTASQKFYLDPQGLAVVATNGSGKGDLPTTGAGIIVGKEKMQIINNSSRPVDVKVGYLLDTDVNEIDVLELASSGTAINAVETDTKPAICLTVNATNTKALAVTAGSVTLAQNATSSIAAATTNSAISPNYTETYTFEDADYVAEFKGSDPTDFDQIHDSSKYEYNMVTSGAALQLEIGGVCNKYGDYSAFTGTTPTKLDLKLTFKLYKVGTTNEVDAVAGAGAGAGATAKLVAGQPMTVSLTTDQSSITSITNNGAAIATSRYTYTHSGTTGTLKFDATYTTNNASAVAGDKTFTLVVTFANGSKRNITVTS